LKAYERTINTMIFQNDVQVKKWRISNQIRWSRSDIEGPDCRRNDCGLSETWREGTSGQTDHNHGGAIKNKVRKWIAKQCVFLTRRLQRKSSNNLHR
jgi:hypothetical protein